MGRRWVDVLVSGLAEGARADRDAPIPFGLTARARQLLDEGDDDPIPYALTELAAGAVVAGACPDCGGYPGHLVGACVCTGGG